jgi:hypothetical protein
MKDNAGCYLIVFRFANKVPEKLITIRVINRSTKTGEFQHFIKMLDLSGHEGPGIHVAHDGRPTGIPSPLINDLATGACPNSCPDQLVRWGRCGGG